jgi:hypothetical protein
LLKSFLIKMSISAVLLVIFSLKFVDVTIGERICEHPLETAWKATGIKLNEISTETWMRYGNRWMSTYELKTVAQEIRGKLCLQLKTKLVSGEQDDFSYVSFEGTQSDGTVVTVTLQSNRSGNCNETQLGINTVHNGSVNNLRFYIDNLKGMIAGLGTGPHFNVLLEGESKGRISQALIRELSGKAFRKINAELVDSAFQGENSFQKGYTRLLKDKITIDSRPVNIEISTRYDAAGDITQVVMGTPNLTDGV